MTLPLICGFAPSDLVWNALYRIDSLLEWLAADIKRKLAAIRLAEVICDFKAI